MYKIDGLAPARAGRGVFQIGGNMDAIRGWIDVIQGGGWSGLLMAGFAVVVAMFIFAFISNRYFWIVLALVAAGFGAYYMLYLR